MAVTEVARTIRALDSLSAADLQLQAHQLRKEAAGIRRQARELDETAARLEAAADAIRQLPLFPAVQS